MDDDVASRWGPRVVEYAAAGPRCRRAGPRPRRLSSPRSASHARRGTRVAIDAGTVPRGAGAVDASLPGNGRWYAAAVTSVVVAVVAGVMIGPAGPAWWRVPLELLDRLPFVSIDSGVTDVEWNIVWMVRMPRVLLGGLVGAMLSLAGASYQGVFRNPLVEPYLLGAAAGAGLGATLVFTVMRAVDAGLAGRPGARRRVRRRPRHGLRHVRRRRLVRRQPHRRDARARRCGRVGARQRRSRRSSCSATSTSSARCSRGSSGACRRRSGTTSSSSCRTSSWRPSCCSPTAGTSTCSASARTRRRRSARRVARVRLVVVIAATLGTAAVVSVSGLIGFVGIVVPHLVRLIAGASYRRVLPLSFLFGATFLIVADIPGRVAAEAGRDADRRRDRVPRRPVPHPRAAHERGR